MIRRGEIWWTDLALPDGSGPGFRRPSVVVQANRYNDSGLRTSVIAIITSNLSLAEAPGNVYLPTRESGLSRPSVVNVAQLFTVDRSRLIERIGRLPPPLQQSVDAGLRAVLSL